MPARLDLYLVKIGQYESRAKAASAIKAGMVKIDGVVVTKPSQKISPEANIEANLEHPWVSRGGQKLAGAFEVFDVPVQSRVCLDIGASTGGFTHVLLSRGASKVFAVDVGQGQLHHSLLSDERVVSMEKTDARNLSADMFSPQPTLVVCDASFISLRKVLAVSLSLMLTGSDLIALVKPQFEVGRNNIGKGGLVKTNEAANKALTEVQLWFEASGWTVKGTDKSPITGGDGNKEFLIWAQK